MTNTMTKEQAIKQYIDEMDVLDLRDVVIAVNTWDGYFDWLAWEDMDNLNDILCGLEPSEIIDKVMYGDFNSNDDYFKFDGYGNLETCSELDMENELDEYRDEIAEYLPDFQGDVWDATLQELINADDSTMFDENLEQVIDDDIDE